VGSTVVVLKEPAGALGAAADGTFTVLFPELAVPCV